MYSVIKFQQDILNINSLQYVVELLCSEIPLQTTDQCFGFFMER